MPAVRFHTSSLFPHLGNGEESGTNIMELPWGCGKSVQDSACTTGAPQPVVTAAVTTINSQEKERHSKISYNVLEGSYCSILTCEHATRDISLEILKLVSRGNCISTSR